MALNTTDGVAAACALSIAAVLHPCARYLQPSCLPCMHSAPSNRPRLSACLQAAKDAEAVLSEQRFAQLDALLSKAGMYTQFLTEQMQAYAAPATGSNQEGGEEEAAEEDTAGEAVGSAGQGSGLVWRFAQCVLCMRTSLTFIITGTTALLPTQFYRRARFLAMAPVCSIQSGCG